MRGKLLIFIFLIAIINIAGCVRPITLSPQVINKEGIEVKVSILDSYEWKTLSKDVLVLNLEVTNMTKESIWIYPTGKSVIIDSLNYQYSPIREIVYQKVEPSPKFSFEILFSTESPPQMSFNIAFGDEEKEKEILKLIEKFNLMRFRDGRIFPGARVSGILLFYISYYKLPARFIIPDVYLEKSNKYVNFEFILGR